MCLNGHERRNEADGIGGASADAINGAASAHVSGDHGRKNASAGIAQRRKGTRM